MLMLDTVFQGLPQWTQPEWLAAREGVERDGHDQRLFDRLLKKFLKLVDNHIREILAGMITKNIGTHIVELHRIRH